MKIFFISLFPDEVFTYINKGIMKRALDSGLVDLSMIHLRDFSVTKHNKVDDYPYGTRQGMLLRVDVLSEAIKSIPDYNSYQLLFPCPKGHIFDQSVASSLSAKKGLIFLPGYYEGVDERIFELFDIQRYSIGDFVVSSGDSPNLLVAEAVTRLCPGVIGKEKGVQDDSIISGRLEGPQYTLPRNYENKLVPDVVISGNHGKISEWKSKESLKETFKRRPSLLRNQSLDTTEQRQLVESIKEMSS